MTVPMRYWLTSHNPHVGAAIADWSVYLRPRDRKPSLEVQPGDKVLIYEQRSGEVDGSGKRVDGGRGGIVSAAEILAGWQPRHTPTEFSLEAPCSNHDCDGYVPRENVNELLGYSKGYNMLGFGKNTGLLELKPQQFESLYAAFKRTTRH